MTDSRIQIVHDNIHQRQSIGQLIEPAPNAEQLDIAIQAALTAPDHHRLKPTRFILIGTEQRQAFGQLLSEVMADLTQVAGEADQAQIERVKQHPFRAPMLLIAVTQLQQHPKVPEFEQILSTGAAVQNLLLSLHAQGFATMWRTGAVVESAVLKHGLGLSEHDLISGIVYIGTAAKAIAARAGIDSAAYLRHWNG